LADGAVGSWRGEWTGPELAAAADFARAEKAAATRRAYGSDFAIFQAWCVERETVAAFLAWEASRRTRPSTIG
jgi:hypothetical protein